MNTRCLVGERSMVSPPRWIGAHRGRCTSAETGISSSCEFPMWCMMSIWFSDASCCDVGATSSRATSAAGRAPGARRRRRAASRAPQRPSPSAMDRPNRVIARLPASVPALPRPPRPAAAPTSTPTIVTSIGRGQSVRCPASARQAGHASTAASRTSIPSPHTSHELLGPDRSGGSTSRAAPGAPGRRRRPTRYRRADLPRASAARPPVRRRATAATPAR